MKQLLQKILFRADRMPERDEHGFVAHPDIDIFVHDGHDNLHDPQDEGYLNKSWMDQCGFNVMAVSLEGDVDEDHPAYKEYSDNGGVNISSWHPVRDGWMLVAIHDTDDGPQALFIQPVPGDTLSHTAFGGEPLPPVPGMSAIPDEQPPLQFRTEGLIQQLNRYRGEVCSHELLDVLWVLTNINDDLIHERDPSFVVANIARAKALLDKVPGELHPDL